jgi:protein-L-isoaspartate(D-aspartate) O-methyltransferase
MPARSRVSVVLLVVLGTLMVAGVATLIVLKARPAASTAATAPTSGDAATGVAAKDGTAAAAPAAPAQPTFDVSKRTDHPPLKDQGQYVAWMLKNTPQEEKFVRAKWARAQTILSWKEIKNDRVLEAFLRTPREEFSRTRNVDVVYAHMVLDIGYGQTISGPHLVAKMTDFLNPEPEHKVLEIGTGSGYQSAVLSELSNHVYTIEIVPQLAAQTNAIYESLYDHYPEYRNIARKEDDGYYGWPEYAPFDRIIVTCGIDHIPPELLKELTVGGVMVIPVGPPSGQTVLKITKSIDQNGEVVLEREDLYGGRLKETFVPFTARGGGVHSQAAEDKKAAGSGTSSP